MLLSMIAGNHLGALCPRNRSKSSPVTNLYVSEVLGGLTLSDKVVLTFVIRRYRISGEYFQSATSALETRVVSRGQKLEMRTLC